jgi:hypothetical protein
MVQQVACTGLGVEHDTRRDGCRSESPALLGLPNQAGFTGNKKAKPVEDRARTGILENKHGRKTPRSDSRGKIIGPIRKEAPPTWRLVKETALRGVDSSCVVWGTWWLVRKRTLPAGKRFRPKHTLPSKRRQSRLITWLHRVVLLRQNEHDGPFVVERTVRWCVISRT